MNDIPDDLVLEILCWVPPLDLLRYTVFVSKRFATMLLDEKEEGKSSWKHFWKQYHNNNDKNSGSGSHHGHPPNLSIHQLQRCCIFAAAISSNGNTDTDTDDDDQQQADQQECQKNTVLLPHFLKNGSVLVSKETAILASPEYRVCLASTTEFVSEQLENVLAPINSTNDFAAGYLTSIFSNLARNMISLANASSGGNSWWSSRPSERNDTNETLLFTTKYPISLLTEVSIKPLIDPFDDETCYTWKQLIIRAYLINNTDTKTQTNPNESDKDELEAPSLSNTPTPLTAPAAATTTTTCILPGYPCKIIQEGQNHVLFNNRNHNHHHQHHHQRRAKCDEGVIESLLKNQTPVYESQIYDLPNSQSVNVQNYLFPKPGIVANVVTITLVGKNSKQFDHTGYYACVDRVDIQGIPLYEKNP